ncbi:MAG: DUF423 domain-containing protein [Candidatus Binatia bacterium]|jgi:uncharacterized membrane protein YgdD (TMEM256/DUF423 family)|nr:DUF423 domain-containing protein [Candidatus Binatia bacterium]MDG2008466.1 DUF423 domain-containing protein [Candidatus Binatia bacterium]HAC78995.1 DUF423 domain-containing protein [Deltaproteobacteria bacterium]
MIGIGAILMALGVVLGAFGAHGLEGKITPEKLATFKTGVDYHLIHALGMIAVGLLAAQRGVSGGMLGGAFWCLFAGVILFSGSLYALSLGGPRWLGPVTPLGGSLFIVGWVLLAWVATRSA